MYVIVYSGRKLSWTLHLVSPRLRLHAPIIGGWSHAMSYCVTCWTCANKKKKNSYQPLLLFELLLLIIFCSIRYHTLQGMVWNCRPRGEKRKELERVWEVRSVGVGSGRPCHTHMWHVGRESSQIYSCCSICCWHVSEKCFITYLPRSFPPDYYHILCSCKVAKIPSTFLLCVAAVLALDYNISLLYPYFCPFHLQIQ